VAAWISSDTIISGLLSPNRKLLCDNDLQSYKKKSDCQIPRKIEPARRICVKSVKSA